MSSFTLPTQLAMFLPALMLSLLSPAASAQTTQTTWGSVVFTFRGEQQPSLSNPLSQSLTSIGAAQAQAAGTLIRQRYLTNRTTSTSTTTSSASSSNNNISFAPIYGINTDLINSDQLTIFSLPDESIAASATAFLQALYPPSAGFQRDDLTVVSNGSGSAGDAGGEYLQYPLGGYQYPNIQTLGDLDWNSIWLAGSQQCISYQLSTFTYSQSPTYQNLLRGTQSFYQSQSAIFSPLQLSPSQLSFTNAYPLYEYAAHQHAHNTSARAALDADPTSPLATLRILASAQQFALNGNLSAFGNTPGDGIRAVAGKTLASKVVGLLGSNIGAKGAYNKLNLLFGSYDPFLAFFALSGLNVRASGSMSALFESLPEPGSVMVFELFSNTPVGAVGPVAFPSEGDLWVRFMFRNGTAGGAPLLSYPLFGRGNSETDVHWRDFKSDMLGVGLGVGDWCKTCSTGGATTSFWCPLFLQNMGSSTGTGSSSGSGSNSLMGSSGSKLNPSVAGVIGAMVTLLVLLILLLAAIFLGGFRLSRRDPRRKSSLGGFKGGDKLKSDVDVSAVKGDEAFGGVNAGVAPGKDAWGGNGAATVVRNERVGSWELGESPKAVDDGMRGGDAGSARVVSMAKYDEDNHSVVDPFGDPVKIDDRI